MMGGRDDLTSASFFRVLFSSPVVRLSPKIAITRGEIGIFWGHFQSIVVLIRAVSVVENTAVGFLVTVFWSTAAAYFFFDFFFEHACHASQERWKKKWKLLIVVFLGDLIENSASHLKADRAKTNNSLWTCNGAHLA
jgi:hypothetical protein